MNDSAEPKRSSSKLVLVVIGLLLLATLPFLPWVFHGWAQGSAEQAVIAAGGRASYGKRLFEEGDYVTDEKRQGKTFIGDLLGDAFVEKLTQVELRKELPDSSVLGKLRKLGDLEILDASGANFGDEQLKLFADSAGLKKLWVNGSRISAAGLEAISGLPTLMSLSIDDTEIGDDAMESVGKHANLKRLYMANTKITDSGIEKLSGLSVLLGIGVEGTGVTDTTVEHLSKMSALKEVRLGDTSITNAGASKLGALKNLQSVNLTNTRLTADGLGWMAEAPELEIVDISGTDIEDDIVDILLKMPKLVSVSLRKTSISADAVQQLKRNLRGATVQYDEDRIQIGR